MNDGKRAVSGRFAHVLHAVYCEPWLIRPEMHAVISAIVLDHITGKAHEEGGRISLMEEMLGDKEQPMTRIADNGVAVVSINGVIGKRVSGLEKSSGIVDVDDVRGELDALESDDAIKGIVLDINSPGGTVTGVPELAARVKRCQKHVVSYTDTMEASAAYWIGSQAWSSWASPSATVGSVGVYLPILDQSRRFDALGVRQEVIKSGKYKGIGIPGTSVSEEQRALLQDRVNGIHAAFKAAVRAGRGKAIEDKHMEGQDFDGAGAVIAGLIDQLGTLNEAIEWAGKQGERR
jgi:signal peptide peptidase SppA